MDAKPINSDHEYRAALQEIDRLMDAQPNTPEGERLDLLAALIETWEEKDCDVDAP